MQDSHRSHCPRCTGDKIYRSRQRGFFENSILPIMGIRPYRCAGCGNRYYRTDHLTTEYEILHGIPEESPHHVTH